MTNEEHRPPGHAGEHETGPSHFKITFKRRQYEDRWTRYREKVLVNRGLSDGEIEALKFNRMTNPRVAMFLRDINDEVDRLKDEYGLPSHAEAAAFRREHFDDLVDNGDIEESDPYIRMGYLE